jgi:MinD-like ATPase involved in chromosome partitioning or flagellar assembly
MAFHKDVGVTQARASWRPDGQSDASTPAPGRPVLAAAERRWQKPLLSRLPETGWPPYHDMVARVAAIERAPVIFALAEGTLRALARRLRRVQVSAGEMVVCQGEPGDSLFFIERGHCRVVIERPPGVVTMALLGEGDFFGDGACLLNRPQQASVYAQSDCTLLAVDRQSLHSVLGPGDRPVIEELRRMSDQRFRAWADSTLQATWGMHLKEATVVGVYSPKGGSGGTCVSLNLVGSLSRHYPGEVLLLDLDFPYTHAALLAGLVPTSCLARTASAPAESFEEVLLSAILYHAGGPMILPGALRPEEADEVTPELITRAIGVLRRTFRYIVVDLGVTITDSTLALFDLTQHVVLIAAPELSALKSAADAIAILSQLGTPRDALTVVLNNRSPKAAVSREAVTRMLARNVDIEIGFDGPRPDQAALDGEILSLTSPRSEVARGTDALAAMLDARHGRSVVAGSHAAQAATAANGGEGAGE